MTRAWPATCEHSMVAQLGPGQGTRHESRSSSRSTSVLCILQATTTTTFASVQAFCAFFLPAGSGLCSAFCISPRSRIRKFCSIQTPFVAIPAAHVYFVLPQHCQHVRHLTPAPPSHSCRDSHHIRYACFLPPWCSKRGVVLWPFDVVNSTPSKYGGLVCVCVRGSLAEAAVGADSYYVSRERGQGQLLLASHSSW